MTRLSGAAVLLLGGCWHATAFVSNRHTASSTLVVPPIGSSNAPAPSKASRTSLNVFSDLPNPFEAFKVPEGIVNAPSEAFDPSPAGLIRQAKRVLSADLGLQDPTLLDDAKFRWIGPVVDQPLGKTDYLAAGRFFDLRSAFPDYDYRSYDFRVVENDPATVRFTCRVTGTMRGELRLRSGILPPTGRRMVCPPEAVSVTFDLRTGNVVKLCTGFCLDRQVGNTDGTTGVMAAATIAGQPMSDWDLYPPASVIARFFGRPAPQLPESKAFLAPFPETVMIQLAKGVLAANMASDDPTLLSDDFTYITPTAGPVKKREFLEKYATEEFAGIVNPSFSFFRVDPYDPVRVWVDVKPTAPGYEGAPQAMSFTFDDEGFCTRITSRAVMDPTIGNGGGLGGPEGYRYATGRGVSDLAARPLPRILGRLRKRLLQPVTGVAPDDYVLPGQTVTPFAQRPVPPAERPLVETKSALQSTKPVSPAARLATASKDSAAEAARRRQEEAEQRARESAQRLEAQRAAAKATQDAAAEEKRRQVEARAAEADRRKREAEKAAEAKAAAQKAEAARRQQELARQRDEKLAAEQAALARKKADQERRERELQAQREKQQSAIAAQKAEMERKNRELQEQRERTLAAQRAEAERKKRETMEAARARGEALQREKEALERKKELAAQQAEEERKKQQALKEAQARAAAEREEAARQRREQEGIKRREEQTRLEEERRRRLEADRRAELERQAAAKEAAAAAAEAERKRQALERQREVERRKEQEEAQRIAEQRRKADEEARIVAQRAAELARKVEQDRQKRQKAAEAELKRVKSSSTLSLFGLGGGKPAPTSSAEQRKNEANKAASQAKPGASIPLFFLGGTDSKPAPKDSGASQRQKAARDAAASAAPRATISLFGSGGGGATPDSAKQQRQQAAKATATNAVPRTSISLFGLGGDQSPKQKPAPTTPPRPTLSLFGSSTTPAPAKPAPASSAPRPTLSLFGQSAPPSSAPKVSQSDLDRQKRKKAALDAVSGAPSGGTVSLFGLGGRKADVPPSAPKPTTPAKSPVGATAKAATAPPGVPTLKNWRKNPGDTVTGIISGSRTFPDGEKVTTSKIASGKLASGEVVRTGSGSRYFLQ